MAATRVSLNDGGHPGSQRFLREVAPRSRARPPAAAHHAFVDDARGRVYGAPETGTSRPFRLVAGTSSVANPSPAALIVSGGYKIATNALRVA